MKEKHITYALSLVLGVVVVAGIVNHYSPDVCHNQTPPTTTTTVSERNPQ